MPKLVHQDDQPNRLKLIKTKQEWLSWLYEILRAEKFKASV